MGASRLTENTGIGIGRAGSLRVADAIDELVELQGPNPQLVAPVVPRHAVGVHFRRVVEIDRGEHRKELHRGAAHPEHRRGFPGPPGPGPASHPAMAGAGTTSGGRAYASAVASDGAGTGAPGPGDTQAVVASRDPRERSGMLTKFRSHRRPPVATTATRRWIARQTFRHIQAARVPAAQGGVVPGPMASDPGRSLRGSGRESRRRAGVAPAARPLPCRVRDGRNALSPPPRRPRFAGIPRAADTGWAGPAHAVHGLRRWGCGLWSRRWSQRDRRRTGAPGCAGDFGISCDANVCLYFQVGGPEAKSLG